MQEREETRWKSPEFFLVVAMLVVLTILVGIVMFAPVKFSDKDTTATATVILDWPCSHESGHMWEEILPHLLCGQVQK